MTKNITLAIDEQVLTTVRKYAASRNTSVNALVREALARIAARHDDAQKAVAELLRLSDESKGEVGPITWTRDDLYDR